MLTTVTDIVGVLLLVLLIPLWIALGLGAVAVVVARHGYWWLRGNTTATSRSGERLPSSPAAPSTPGTSARSAGDETRLTSLVDEPPAALSPAVPGAPAR
jgi:hypothetical protein